MGRPRRISDGQVLAAAREVFLRLGPRATTRDVAEAAGVSQTVLFQRYRTKKSLYFAALLRSPIAPDDLFGTRPESAGAAGPYLVALAIRMLDWLDAALPGSLRAALDHELHDALDRVHGAPFPMTYLDRMMDVIAAIGLLTSPPDPRPSSELARAFLEAAHGQALLALLLPSAEPAEQRARRLVRSFWPSLPGMGS